MQNFSNSHGFSIGTVNAVDNTRYQIYTTNSHVESDAAALYQLQQAACLAAGHQSSERFDPPKCHPETRTAVINDIMSWVDANEPEKGIMWLNSPAGGGKSSIAQTVAERCHDEHKLLSSFFFSRTTTTSGRDDGTRLIPTIAYHLAVALPEAKKYILAKLRRNTAILSSSMDAQMESLVVEPLKSARMAHVNVAGSLPVPQLVIVDGLDECNKPEVQSMILKVIARILAQPSVHLRFLVASRPEWEIQKAFNLPTFAGIYIPLTLDDSYKPNKDIKIYLRSELSAVRRTHPSGKYLTTAWPSGADLNALVRKSSGQFIYASTIIKFIVNDRGNPRDRLQVILDVSSAVGISKKSPYAQLDALYTHILSTAADAAEDGYDSFYPALEVLLYSEDDYREYIFKNDSDEHSAQKLAGFLGIDRFKLQSSLVDLCSILHIPSLDSPDLEIRFFHASFSDFLKDSSRSKGFFIPEDKAHISLGQHCIAILSDPELPVTWEMCSEVQKYAKRGYFLHLKRSNFDDELLNETRSRDIKSFMNSVLSGFGSTDYENLLRSVVNDCWVEIFPRSEELRDMFNCILEAFDALQDYSKFDVYRSIDCICKMRRDPVKWNATTIPLYRFLRFTCIEDPMRGKRQGVFMCDETCRDLFQDLCHKWLNVTTAGFEGHQEWEWIEVMKYLLGKIEPSYDFGIFLQGEIPRIRSFLVDEPLMSHNIDHWPGYYRSEASELDLKKELLIEFVKDVNTYLKKCNVPFPGEKGFWNSAVIALNVAVEKLLGD